MCLPGTDDLKIEEIGDDIFNHVFLPIISIHKIIKAFFKSFFCVNMRKKII